MRTLYAVIAVSLAALIWSFGSPDKINLTDDGSNSPAFTIDHGCYVDAVGSGIGEDARNIQRAIDLAAAHGCLDDTVHLLPKTYYLQNPIFFYSNVPVRLDGAGSNLMPVDKASSAIEIKQ